MRGAASGGDSILRYSKKYAVASFVWNTDPRAMAQPVLAYTIAYLLAGSTHLHWLDAFVNR